MKKIPSTIRLAILLLLWAGVAGAPVLRAGNLALAPGDPSPTMVGWTLDGKLQTIEWQGVTLLNFWATWCEACRNEMPELQKLEDEYGDQGLRVFGLNREPTTAEEIRKFLESTGVQYPQLKPDKRLAQAWTGVNVLPTTYLVGAEGKILRKYVGASTEQIQGLRDDIDNLVNGRPMGPMVIVKPTVTQTKVYN